MKSIEIYLGHSIMEMSGEIRSPHHDRVTCGKFQLTSYTPHRFFQFAKFIGIR